MVVYNNKNNKKSHHNLKKIGFEGLYTRVLPKSANFQLFHMFFYTDAQPHIYILICILQ